MIKMFHKIEIIKMTSNMDLYQLPFKMYCSRVGKWEIREGYWSEHTNFQV